MIAFLAVAAVVIVSPGPDFALTVHNTVARGRRAGMLTGFGIVSGQLLWGVATAAGLAALLVAFRPAFVGLRLIGAAYLVWLGIGALRSAWRGREHQLRVTSDGSSFRRGFLSNAGNPKMAIFFTSLLPQFGSSLPELVAHSLLFSTLTLAWLALVVRAGSALRVPRVRRILDALTGVVLVGFGGVLALDRGR
ncbi:MAG TPA: LysE family translocator [Gaiellaceae bacterium]|nr:LysE family translocator [Gaiellaceae bacterium]